MSNRLELIKHLTTVYKDTRERFKKEYKLDLDLVLDKVSKIKLSKKLIKENRIRIINIGRVLYLPL